MRRRQLVASLVAILTGACSWPWSRSDCETMPDTAPGKIRLVPDHWHMLNVGILKDGRVFFVDTQLDPSKGATKDFVCTFVFDSTGRLSEHSIELIGVRGSYPVGSVRDALSRHLTALGDRSTNDVWVKPFSVLSNGTTFGLIPRQTTSGHWRVEFMPGNTFSFCAPWDVGGYDT